jgi:hypothetical protein
MTTATPEHSLTAERLAGLVFELASQLHVERTCRLALEAALVNAGVLTREAVEAIANDSAVRERMQAALEVSMRKLMQVITEGADPRFPLRHLAPTDSR